MPSADWSQLGLHVIAKPTGPLCDLTCAYCFYLEKESLYPRQQRWRMSDATLEAYVRQYIEAQPEHVEEIDFAFQGGEPTLLGLDFFRRAVELEKKYLPPGKRIRNSLQTNGILLDDDWCEFLRRNDFLVGISIDGPADLHDKYRRDRQGKGSFDRVTRAVARLRNQGVEFNTLTCVNRYNGDHPLRVYRFLRELGSRFMQFIPVVEPLPGILERTEPCDDSPERLVRETSVRPKQFGRFLIGLFDEWVGSDVGSVFVRDFDQALSCWAGEGATLCVYAKHCGRAAAVEHNGDLYSCDHFVDAKHKLGNIHETPIRELADSDRQRQFGLDKQQLLPARCRKCTHLFACNGACPKDRFPCGPDGLPGPNYLCAGYDLFFTHISACMRAMAAELQAGRPAANVMHQIRARRQRVREEAAGREVAVGRNGPCPCGSGKKFKQCCMRR